MFVWKQKHKRMASTSGSGLITFSWLGAMELCYPQRWGVHSETAITKRACYKMLGRWLALSESPGSIAGYISNKTT